MDTLIVILLSIIAYILWRFYKIKEIEQIQLHNEKIDVEYEKNKENRFKDYPNLYGKLEGNWLEVFAHHSENGIPMINLAFMLYLNESTKIEYSEGSLQWDNLWDLTEELLEHLENFHEGSAAEHLIAVCTYWQIAAEAISDLIENSPNKVTSESGRESAEIDGKALRKVPFTNIENIIRLFPKKPNHPETELSFRDEKGNFPRKSKGSEIIHNRITL